MAQVVEQVAELVEPILEELGFELVDIEYQREGHGWVLRFFLDKEGGITLDDCADWLDGQRSMPARSVAVTFDDGYRSVAEVALPLLDAMVWFVCAWMAKSCGKPNGSLVSIKVV